MDTPARQLRWRRELGLQVSGDCLRRAPLEDERRGQRDACLLLELQRKLRGCERIEPSLHKWRSRCHLLVARVHFHDIENDIDQLCQWQ